MVIKRKLVSAWDLTKATFNDWIDDNAPRLGAALAYYTLFSIAPMLVVTIAIAGLVFGEEAARGQIVAQLQGLIGGDGARLVESLLQSVSSPAHGVIATIIGIFTFLLGATTAFVELQSALNTVWEVQPKPGRGVWGILRDRLLSFSMLLGIGFLLLVSLLLSAALAAISAYMGARFSGFVHLAQILNLLLSVSVITVLFAMIYKYLPDVKLAWRDVWVGALVTSLLFTLGKTLIGLYLGKSSVASGYGAAGSVAVFLIWVYYSSQILLLGAEFTQVYAERYGSDVQPADNAMYTPDHEQKTRARLGKKASDKNDDEKRFRMPPLPGGHRPQNV